MKTSFLFGRLAYLPAALLLSALGCGDRGYVEPESEPPVLRTFALTSTGLTLDSAGYPQRVCINGVGCTDNGGSFTSGTIAPGTYDVTEAQSVELDSLSNSLGTLVVDAGGVATLTSSHFDEVSNSLIRLRTVPVTIETAGYRGNLLVSGVVLSTGAAPSWTATLITGRRYTLSDQSSANVAGNSNHFSAAWDVRVEANGQVGAGTETRRHFDVDSVGRRLIARTLVVTIDQAGYTGDLQVRSVTTGVGQVWTVSLIRERSYGLSDASSADYAGASNGLSVSSWDVRLETDDTLSAGTDTLRHFTLNASARRLTARTVNLNIDQAGYPGNLAVVSVFAGSGANFTVPLLRNRSYNLSDGSSADLGRTRNHLTAASWDVKLNAQDQLEASEILRHFTLNAASRTLTARTVTMTVDQAGYTGDLQVQSVRTGSGNIWTVPLMRERTYNVADISSADLSGTRNLFAATSWELSVGADDRIGLGTALQPYFTLDTAGRTITARILRVTVNHAGYTGTLRIDSVRTGSQQTWTADLIRERSYNISDVSSADLGITTNGFSPTPWEMKLEQNDHLSLGTNLQRHFTFDGPGRSVTARTLPVTIDPAGFPGSLSISSVHTAQGAPWTVQLIRHRSYQMHSQHSADLTAARNGYSSTYDLFLYPDDTLYAGTQIGQHFLAFPSERRLQAIVVGMTVTSIDMTGVYGIRDLASSSTGVGSSIGFPVIRGRRYYADPGGAEIQVSSGGACTPSTVAVTGGTLRVACTAIAGPPAAPSNFRASIVTTSSIQLRWIDSSLNEAGFGVERAPEGTSNWTRVAPCDVGPNVTSCTDQTGLIQGARYHYRVYSFTGEGQAYAPTATMLFDRPAAPSALVGEATGTDEVTLRWTDNSNTEQGFHVERSPNGMSFAQVGTTLPEIRSFADGPLMGAGPFHYQVRAYNAFGESMPSNVQNISIGTPGPPSNVQAQLVNWIGGTTGIVHVTWNDNSSNETGFTIERSTDGGNSFVPAGTAERDTGGAAGGFADTVGVGTYVYRVQAVNGSGISTGAVSPAVTVGPMTGPVLSGTLVSANRIDLSWTALTNVTSAVLYREVDGTGFTQWRTLTLPDSSESDTSTTQDHTYRYRLDVTGPSGAASSNIVSFSTARPAPPTSLWGTIPAQGTAVVNWDYPNDVATGFDVQWRIGTSGSFTALGSVGALIRRSADHTGHPASRSLQYQVRAKNGAGIGNWSATLAFTMAIPPAPSAPSATILSANQVRVRWTDNSHNENGFIVSRLTNGGGPVDLPITAPRATELVDISAIYGPRYTYRVRSNNAYGSSSNVTAPDVTMITPNPATALAAVIQSPPTRVNLSWTNGSTLATTIRIERTPVGLSTATVFPLTLGATSYSDATAEVGTTYDYRVVSENVLGPSASTAVRVAMVVPPAPTNLVGRATANNAVNLTWDFAGSQHKGFRIERATGTGGFDFSTTVGPTIRSFNNTGTPTSATLRYRVSAENGVGFGPPSTEITTSTAAPAAPSGMLAKIITNTPSPRVDLTWLDNASNETGYRVQHSTNNGSSWTTLPAVLDPNVQAYSITTGLSPNTTYHFRVYAASGAGNTNAIADITRTAVVPTTAPTSLTATAQGAGRVRLAWAWNVTTPNENGTEIQRSPLGTPVWTTIGNAERKLRVYADNTAQTGVGYQYQVRAFNGITPPSNFSNIATMSGTVGCEGKANGTSCDDGNSCTTGDSCQNQVCVTTTAPDGAGCDTGVATCGAGSCRAGACRLPGDGSCAIEPLVTCVVQRSAPSQYVAVFGYRNNASQNVNVPVSSNNTLTASAGAVTQTQPTWFKARTAAEPQQDLAFSVPYTPGGTVTWRVGTRQITAQNLAAGTCSAVNENGTDGPTVTAGGREHTIAYDRGRMATASVVAPDLIPGQALTTPGGLTGSLDVTNDGSASYSLPIDVPPGRLGMQPSLAISYSSRGVNGLLGVGWNLSGLSEIAPCRPRLGLDPDLRPIEFNGSDPICLDGQRLIPLTNAGPALQAAGTQEYRLEHDRGTRVLARDVVNGVPIWFEVYQRSGRIMRFGMHPRYMGGAGTGDLNWSLGRARRFTADPATGLPTAVLSRPIVTVAWPLTEVRDRFDNLVTVAYDVTPINAEAYEHRPLSITYTGRPGVPGRRAVRFAYESRVHGANEAGSPSFDAVERYFSGVKMDVRERLARIDLVAPRYPADVTQAPTSETIGSYRLSYEASPMSSRSRLTTVTRCDGGGVCMAPVTFKYTDGYKERHPVTGAPLYAQPFSQRLAGITEPGTEGGPLIVGDIDGDGRDDVAWTYRTPHPTRPNSTIGRLKYALATQSGLALFETPREIQDGVSSDGPRAASFQDVDGDGKADIITNQGLFFNRGTRTSPSFIGSTVNDVFNSADVRFQDVDGDRRLDALFWGASVAPWRDFCEDTTTPESQTCHDSGWVFSWAWSRQVTTGAFARQPFTFGPTSKERRPYTAIFMDLNGDGRLDAIDDMTDAGPQAEGYSYLFQGNASVPSARYQIEQGSPGNPVDRNADGLPDLTYALRKKPPSPGALPDAPPTYEFYRVTNTGNGLKLDLIGPPTQGGPAPEYIAPSHMRSLDFNGDGRMDVLNARASVADPWLSVQINSGSRECKSPGATGSGPNDCSGIAATRLPWGRASRRAKRVVMICDGQEVSPDEVYVGGCPPGPTASAVCWNYKVPNPLGGSGTVCTSEEVDLEEDNAANEYRQTQVLDVNGDGLSDVVMVDRQAPHAVSVWVQNGVKTDMLQAVVDGRGAKATLEYGPMTGGNVTRGTEPCAYPYDCVNRGMWVVTALNRDQGVVNQNAPMVRDNFSYTDGRSQILGGGWLGFKSRRMQRSISGSLMETVTTTFARTHESERNNFPYRMMPTKQEVVLARDGVGSARVTETFHLPPRYGVAGTAPGSNQGIFRVDVDHVDTTEYESHDLAPLQSLAKQKTVRTLVSDVYGNVTSAVNTTLWWSRPTTAATQYVAVDRRLTSYEASPNAQVFHEGAYLGLAIRVEETATYPGTITAPTARVQTFVPDPARGVIVSGTIQPGGGVDKQLTETYTRDPANFGQVNRVDVADLAGNVRFSDMVFDPVERIFPEESVNQLGQRTRTYFHPGLGVPVWSADVNGRVSRVRYDTFGRSKAVDGPLQADGTVTYSQDAEHPLIVETISNTGAASRQGFDRFGRETMSSSRTFDGGWVTALSTYDAEGQLSSKTGPYGTITYVYDGIGRLIQTLRWDDDPSLGQVGTTVTYGPDEFFKMTTKRPGEREEDRRESYVITDAFGRTMETGQKNGLVWEKTNYSYKPFGLLWKIASGPDSDRVETEYGYDDLGRRTSLTNPRPVSNPTVLTSSWTYNAFGEALSETDPENRTTVLRYDPVGRLERRQFGSAPTSPANVYTFDTAPNGIGMPATSTSLDGVRRTFEYDATFGGVAAETLMVPGENDSRPIRQTQTYDSFGRAATLTYPVATARTDLTPLTVSYGYGSNGTLSSVNQTGTGARTIWRAASREQLGRIETETFDDGAITSSRSYLPNTGRLHTIDTRNSGQFVQNLSFDYYPDANVKRKRDFVEGLHQAFVYDSMERLWQWNELRPDNNDRRPGGFGVTYGYDDHSNLFVRLTSGGAGDQTVLYRHDRTNNAGPHAVTSADLWPGATISYDRVGNMVQHPQAGTIAYTPFNLPRSITGPMPSSYLYDASDRRVRKVVGGKTTLYFGGTYERRAEGGDRLHVFSVSNGERVVAQITRSDVTGADQTSFLQADPLGTTEGVSGANAGRPRRDPFGNRITRDGAGTWDVRLSGAPPLPQGLSATTVGYTGHEQEDDLGLINMRGRIYDARLARFMQMDPLVMNDASVGGVNRYSYVKNNPIRFTDPTGFAWTDCSVYDNSGELTEQRSCNTPDDPDRHRFLVGVEATLTAMEREYEGEVAAWRGRVVAAREAAAADRGQGTGSSSTIPPPNLRKLNAGERATVADDLVRARMMVNQAIGALARWNSADRANFQKWFGTTSAQAKWQVSIGFSALQTQLAAMTVSNFKFDRALKRDWVAAADVDNPSRVRLGELYFDSNETGPRGRAGTIIHEVSHFDIIAGTNSVQADVYGAKDSRDLATMNPTGALDNADNWTFFALQSGR